MVRAEGDKDEEAMPLMSVGWLTDKVRRRKPGRIQWARMGWSMLPWIITAPLDKTERALPKVTSTSYLNGFRGLSAVIVYNFHLVSVVNPPLKIAIGRVPFANAVIAGPGATMVFFVLSGFVLSLSSLSKISSYSSSGGSSDAVDSAILTSLWSSLIRRGFRLFTPFVVLGLLLSLITFFTPVYAPSAQLPWADAHPRTLGTFFDHLCSYTRLVMAQMNPFSWSSFQPYTLEHTWTLPFEYRCSLVVFLLCVVCTRLTPRCRKLLLVGFALWALHWVRWDVFCFTAGMFLAELRFQPLFPPFSSSSSSAGPKTKSLPFFSTAEILTSRRLRTIPVRPLIALLALGPAIIVCSFPDDGATIGVEPFRTLHAVFTPAHYPGGDIVFLYASVGAFAVLACLEALPPFQWLLSTAPMRYLGEISFSFYLLHLLLIKALSARTLVFLTDTCGWYHMPAFVATWLVTGAATVLAADLFWRGVDETSVRMSRKISEWLIAKPKDPEIAYHALRR